MGSNPQPAKSAAAEREGPPVPDVIFKLINPIMKLILRSPFHRWVSDDLMVITFQGRKSGKTYSTPVGYRQYGDTLVVFTHSPWWKNLRGGQPVTVRLRGEKRQGTARPTRDLDTAVKYTQKVIDRHGLAASRRLGIQLPEDAEVTEDLVREAVRGTIVIEIELED